MQLASADDQSTVTLWGYGTHNFGRMHARQDVQSSQILIYILSSGLDMTEAPSFFFHLLRGLLHILRPN